MLHNARIALHSNVLYTILVIGFVYTLHLTLPIYISSSFLGQYATASGIGIIYTVSALATAIGFLSMNRILTRFGNRTTTLWLVGIQILLFWGIIHSEIPWLIATFFILETAVVAMIGLSMDVFLEAYSDVQHVGGIRGLYLTITNTAWILAPLIGASIVDGDQYKRIFMASFGLLFLLFYLVRKNFTHFHDPKYPRISVAKTIEHISHNSDLVKVFSANIILQTFYAWMVIYSPIYLHEHLGFAWDEIGIMFTIMLLPFVIFELPLGKLADRGLGEKEIMSAGFIILGAATYALSFISAHSVFLWALALFITRVGASSAEVMIETYFFKKIAVRESNVLGVFRITRPFAYIIAPFITAIGLLYTSEQNLFIILGLFVFCGLFFTLTIRDTA